jgi:hypothetical protein
VYCYLWEYVGTIQIPHHGDLKAYCDSELTKRFYNCPISFGKHNSYGHPSSLVIAKILSKFSCPIMVTEDLDSVFIETIL